MKQTAQPNAIRIYDNNTEETGTYTVWFYNGKEQEKRTCTEAFVNGCLSMRQKEGFFMGQSAFLIDASDFKQLANSNPSEVLKSKYEA